jgi:hypothetical protein
MMPKKWIFLVGCGLALVVNPYLACSSSEDDFTYSEQDMKAAILGEWQGSGELDGEAIAFTLTLEQASAMSKTQSVSAPRIKPQCGSRSFVKPAAACASESVMPLVGTIISVSPTLNGTVTGELSAARNLDSAGLRLQLEDGKTLNATLRGDELRDGYIVASAQVGVFSLSRP